jgi:hypothetical protein
MMLDLVSQTKHFRNQSANHEDNKEHMESKAYQKRN